MRTPKKPDLSRPKFRRFIIVIGVLAVVIGGLHAASAIVSVVLSILTALGVDFRSFNTNVLQTVLATIIYALIIAGLLVGTRILRRDTSLDWFKRLLGLTRLPEWKDFLFYIGGYLLYIAGVLLLVYLVGRLLPGYDATQAQDTGFSKTLTQGEGLIVFIALVVVAPVCEEIIFRGWLFGVIRRQVPLWLAILLVSLAFAFVHGQLNVGVDVFALSIVLCLVREFSGSLWPSILIHMTKNAIAFFALYIASGNLL